MVHLNLSTFIMKYVMARQYDRFFLLLLLGKPAGRAPARQLPAPTLHVKTGQQFFPSVTP